MTVVVGEDIKVGPHERVYIDCGGRIDETGVPNPNVTWYHNGFELFNGSVPNVVTPKNKRSSIIVGTLFPVDDQPGNDGNYTCVVCSNASTCMDYSTTIDVCGK